MVIIAGLTSCLYDMMVGGNYSRFDSSCLYDCLYDMMVGCN